MAASQNINLILEKIYVLESSIGTIDHQKVESFIKSAINGDTLIDSLVLLATYGEKDEDCILVHILTTGKLTKIRVVKDGFTSSSAYLNQIIGVNKEDIGENNAKITVEYPQGRIGLTYPLSDAQVDSFFQKVDEAVRTQRKPNG
ncbi:MAG: hypothetical protein WC645_00615 [Candidatus Margulisiibacteriota bacterium]